MSYFTFKNGQETESNSFANLARISDKDIMEEDQENVEESLKHKLISRFDIKWCFNRPIQMPFLKVKELNFACSWNQQFLS